MYKYLIYRNLLGILGIEMEGEQGMTTQDLILNLEAAGLDAPQIEQYLAYGQAENTARQLQLLSRHRAALLDRVHQTEKQIGCLDYLVYRIQRCPADPHTSSRNGGTTP